MVQQSLRQRPWELVADLASRHTLRLFGQAARVISMSGPFLLARQGEKDERVRFVSARGERPAPQPPRIVGINKCCTDDHNSRSSRALLVSEERLLKGLRTSLCVPHARTGRLSVPNFSAAFPPARLRDFIGYYSKYPRCAGPRRINSPHRAFDQSPTVRPPGSKYSQRVGRSWILWVVRRGAVCRSASASMWVQSHRLPQ